jgi:hypothetical protein
LTAKNAELFAKSAKRTQAVFSKKKGPISGATFSKEAGQVGVRKGDARDRSRRRIDSKKVDTE